LFFTGIDGANFFACPDHVDTELGFKHGVHGRFGLGEPFKVETFE
jgi:hypothetical protein